MQGLDAASYPLYKKVIEYETGLDLSMTDGGFTLGGTPLSEYIFRENYYFVGGDNVLDSADSRYWGFVPEQFIIGVTRRIAWSRDRHTGKLRWERVWRRIDD